MLRATYAVLLCVSGYSVNFGTDYALKACSLSKQFKNNRIEMILIENFCTEGNFSGRLYHWILSHPSVCLIWLVLTLLENICRDGTRHPSHQILQVETKRSGTCLHGLIYRTTGSKLLVLAELMAMCLINVILVSGTSCTAYKKL